MAHVFRIALTSHLRAEPNQYILHYRKGRLVRKGAGIAYWFNPLTAAVAQVPVEDCETTFVLKERSQDFQEVTVQVTLVYRFADPEKVAARVNFTLDLARGKWVEQPLEKLASLWSQKSQQPVRTTVTRMPIVEVVQMGADRVQEALEQALRTDAELAGMGLGLVSVQVNRVAPTAELEKAVQTPTREALQQKADEAVFNRRAVAVEKERAIKENELDTQIELAKRQELLIRQQGSNRLLEIRQEAETESTRLQAELERQRLAAEAYARETLTRAKGDADASREITLAAAEDEARRVDLWREAPPQVALGLAAQRFADKIQTIQHLNLTPDLLGSVFQQFLRDQASH